ncbi:trifunctional aldehyde reductase/carbonyl reductase (NADPH)/glucose 1-dehydrogenase (NADP(+)) YPR1 [Sugiyamaella lignohabitans]|uniref:Trifunctional aldehyde reductase/carbonyl reductase (NADPH)/glucose 1-dehydrogenase (NADP(+)) YPR1 n=1 Tax=Sugiyamaella lignohabitans TaxID=796027 RepID=A0A161HGZ9_9ASCO|nr:trifunctional aldehyde reductase/carbonyl reductase (NADPH)/glucose 1-dehydrogenase (NADP(+)) YPR1 [Sugiyamaella lignohabitans]ANB11207.1 trifunctional aldehyde reductase/carbonyl reductase (NADPH)/glucose 1-dehydrogenase (NADP(+)) YPR1 [Sugiyamaella lignohabitans]
MAPTLNKQTVTLNDGSKLPVVGYGTYAVTDETNGYDALLEALKKGYRHIDTAFIYNNEEVVGKAVKDSGIPRDEIFIVTKIWNNDHQDPAHALERSLRLMELDYVDLLLIHWPVPQKAEGGETVVDKEWSHVKTWQLLQELPREKVRSIGVSNYDTVLLEELLNAPSTKVLPSVNQVELHPYLPQDKLRDYCQKKKIVLEAYCPLGSGAKLLENPLLKELAEKYEATPAQIALSWGISRGYVVLTKSSTPSRIESNIQTVELSPEDITKITNLSKTHPHRIVVPTWAKGVTFHDDDF